jgi:hypothetical protein
MRRRHAVSSRVDSLLSAYSGGIGGSAQSHPGLPVLLRIACSQTNDETPTRPSNEDPALPDFLRIQGGFESPLGAFTSFAIDRYGNLYVQPVGAAIGTPGAFGSITAGWLFTTYKPSEEEVRSFLEGQSYSGGGALGAALDWTWSPNASGAQHAVEVGVGSPRGGASVGTGYLATRLPLGW